MRTVSIRQLHEATGRYVREACAQPLVVTDHGTKLAVIKAYSPDELPGRPFPRRDPSELPEVGLDSTDIITQDRDQR